MKRKGNLYHRIAMMDNLYDAYGKASKGKKDRKEVIEFRHHFDEEIETLRKGIILKNLKLGRYRFFMVRDPKLREICAASFSERVLHHAVMNICEPILEQYSIFDSYACRKGKGLHRAIRRAQAFSRKNNWYLKLDIRKYFDSIDHIILLGLLSRKIKDKDVLELIEAILSTYETKTGKGVPIGNLISQHMANFYLGRFDHWIKETRRVKAYLRYMDDFVLFGKEKNLLKTELDSIREFLHQELRLSLKDNIQLNRCRHGLPFLGFQVYPGFVKLSPRSRKRFIEKFKAYEYQYITGRWEESELAERMTALVEFTKTADAGNFRRNVIQRYGFSSYG